MNPFELIDYVAFGITLGLGLLVGRGMRPRPPQPLMPVCTCTHGWGQHEDGRRCQGQIQRRMYDTFGGRLGIEYVQCPCLRYDGPSMELLGRFVP